MLKKELLWVEGDQMNKLSIIMPTGNGEVAQIFLDKLYLGQAVQYKGEWGFYLNENSPLVSEDLSILSQELTSTEKPR
jgi:hypothetical protein